jgi:hypothetical protein
VTPCTTWYGFIGNGCERSTSVSTAADAALGADSAATAAQRRRRRRGTSLECSAKSRRVESLGVGWIFAFLLAGAIAVLVAAEWPRLAPRFGGTLERRPRRRGTRRKSHLRLIQTESEEFAASVEKDLQSLPTIDERDRGG